MTESIHTPDVEYTDTEPGENISYVAGWAVIYPSTCNGGLRDLGFIYRVNGYRSDFVHFNERGIPYGPTVPKKVAARLVAMRNRYRKNNNNNEGK